MLLHSSKNWRIKLSHKKLRNTRKYNRIGNHLGNVTAVTLVRADNIMQQITSIPTCRRTQAETQSTNWIIYYHRPVIMLFQPEHLPFPAVISLIFCGATNSTEKIISEREARTRARLTISQTFCRVSLQTLTSVLVPSSETPSKILQREFE